MDILSRSLVILMRTEPQLQGIRHARRQRDIARDLRIPAWVLSSLLLACVPIPSAAEVKQLSPAVRTALEETANAINPIEISWKFSRTSNIAPSQLMSQLGYQESAGDSFFETMNVKYISQDAMVYSLQEFSHVDPNTKRPDSRTEELSFNLEKYFNGTGIAQSRGRKQQAKLAVRSAQKGASRTPDEVIIPATYFSVAGFVMPDTWRGLFERQPAQSLILYLIHRQYLDLISETKVDLNQHSVVLLELSGKERDYRFFLDPERHHALIRKDELTKKGELAVRIDNATFESVSGRELWLPRSSMIQRFSSKPEPDIVSSEALYSEHVDVTRITLDRVPVETFSLDYSNVPGTRIVDDTHASGQKVVDGEVSYEVPASASRIERAIDTYVENRQQEQQELAGMKKPGRISFLVLNTVCLGALIFVLIARRSLRVRAQKSDLVS